MRAALNVCRTVVVVVSVLFDGSAFKWLLRVTQGVTQERASAPNQSWQTSV